jgi:hypothetical protein
LQQVDPTTVAVSGSVLVSDLTSSPAVLNLTVTGADACGHAGSDTVQVQVVDTTPPEIDVSVSPDLLWPPNHTMRNVTATVTATDNCPGVNYVLSAVTSSEPDNGLGDGDTENDIQNAAIGTPDTSVDLRAERDGRGSGRFYLLWYTATDGSGNTAEDSATVTVPHSQKP